MDTNNFEETLKQLQTKVDKISGVTEIQRPKSLSSFSFKNFQVKKNVLITVGIPIGIIILLVLGKPKIVMEEAIDPDGTVYQKISTRRVLVATISIILLLCGGYWLWNYKKL